MAIFKEILLNAGEQPVRIFEWGSGASSIFYPKFLKSAGHKFQWHAMENSAAWHKKTQERITRSRLADEVHLNLSEFPGFWQLPGYSDDDPVPAQPNVHSANVLDYINAPKQLGELFDIVIIDGRFRRRCLLVAREVLAPGGVVILHDAQKVHYHSSLSSYPNVRFIRTGLLPVPNVGQRSIIALCTLENSQSLERLFVKYHSFSWDASS